jgi:hypothetical protein
VGIEDIAPQLQQFIQRHIHSVEQLEVLLLLHDSPSKEWNADEIAQRLYTAPDAALSRLRDLVHSKLVAERSALPSVFQYNPPSDEMRRSVDTLAQVYRERRVSVVSLIYAKPNNSIRAFSDAFRLFKPKPDEQKPDKEGN